VLHLPHGRKLKALPPSLSSRSEWLRSRGVDGRSDMAPP
jgi:hypothetical protein